MYISHMLLLVLFTLGLIAQLAAEIDGTVTVTGVTEGSRIPAGSTTTIGVTYNPITTPAPTSLIHLECPETSLPSVSMSITGTDPISFPVPKEFYGLCTFSATNPDGLYLSGPPFEVTITQTLFIEEPVMGQVIQYPDQIPTLVRTGFVNISVSINMTLICSLTSVPYTYLVPSNILADIPANENNLGSCQYYATSLPLPYFELPAPVSFSVKVTFVVTDTSAVIQSGIPFEFGLFTPQPFLSHVESRINLNCSGTIIRSWAVSINRIVDKVLLYPSSSNCILNQDPTSEVFSYFEKPVVIINPSFASPLNGESFIRNGTVLVALKDFSGYSSANATQTCGSDVLKLPLDSNFQAIFDLPTGYVGNCQYTAETVNPSIIDSVYITVEYLLELKFTQSPPTIIGNITFTIELASSCVNDLSAPKVIAVTLVCNTGTLIVYTWNSVSLNEPVSLVLPGDTKAQSCCVFSTPASDPFYMRAAVPVKLIQSPFGGVVQEMSEEELSLFRNSITIISKNFYRKISK